MISLISPALIIPAVSYLGARAPGLRPARALRRWLPGFAPPPPPLPSPPPLPCVLPRREAATHPRELAVQPPVHQHAADLGDEAAEQRRVHRLLEHDLPVVAHPAEAARERRALLPAARDRGAHAGAHAARRGVGQVAGGGADRRPMIRAPAPPG